MHIGYLLNTPSVDHVIRIILLPLGTVAFSVSILGRMDLLQDAESIANIHTGANEPVRQIPASSIYRREKQIFTSYCGENATIPGTVCFRK